MGRPHDAGTTEDLDARVEIPMDASADPEVDFDRDDEDTVILPARTDLPVDDDSDIDPFIDDEEPADDTVGAPTVSTGSPAAEARAGSPAAEARAGSPAPEANAPAAPAPEAPAVDEVSPASAPLAGLARYTPTGSIPIVGEALPITGSMPVLGQIYPPKSRRPWIIATCVLAALLIGAGYLGWRMWEINDEWHAYANGLTEANYTLGDQIADVKQDLTERQNEVDLLSEQLATSNSRLLDVSAEKASALDDQEYASQVIADLQDTLTLGQTATASLNQCIDGLEQLTTYLEAPEDEYDAEQVSEYADGVTALCEGSDAATSSFQAALTE